MSIAQKALSLARAVTGPSASPEEVERRLAICRQCEHLDTRDDGKIYCGRCKCGRWPLSELHRKLQFHNLRCPDGRWGDADGITIEQATRKEALQEMIEYQKHLHTAQDPRAPKEERIAALRMLPVEIVQRYFDPNLAGHKETSHGNP